MIISVVQKQNCLGSDEFNFLQRIRDRTRFGDFYGMPILLGFEQKVSTTSASSSTFPTKSKTGESESPDNFFIPDFGSTLSKTLMKKVRDLSILSVLSSVPSNNSDLHRKERVCISF